nr:hypothetical protein [uncultured Draconibacterium sp.]
MALNLPTGNMYKFVTHTWNTIKGACPYNCKYCYMHKYCKSDKLYLDESELRTHLRWGNFIYVGSNGDMFADGVESEWIVRTLEHCDKFNNRYFLQTKNPKRFQEFNFMKSKYHVCTTLESDLIHKEFMGAAPTPQERAEAMPKGHSITIEPIMDFNPDKFLPLIESCNPQYVNIGADSGNNKLPEPSKEKVKELIKGLESFTKVYKKENLFRILEA